jgi:hypothetical protein
MAGRASNGESTIDKGADGRGERMLAGSQWQDDDLLFAQANGRLIDKKSDYDEGTRLLQLAGVRHVRRRGRLLLSSRPRRRRAACPDYRRPATSSAVRSFVLWFWCTS